MMRAWSGEGGDVMGPTVPSTESPKPTTPPLKNGNNLVESGYLVAVGSRTSRFRKKHKDKITIIILICFLAALLVLAIVMTILYALQKHHKPLLIRICESKECLRSASNLALSMDETVDPCEDFYQLITDKAGAERAPPVRMAVSAQRRCYERSARAFENLREPMRAHISSETLPISVETLLQLDGVYACGNWAEEHPHPDSYQSFDWFRGKQDKVDTLVRDFLNKNTSDHPRTVQYAKDMYATCMDTETLDKRGVKPIFDVLSSLGLPPFPTYINLTEDYDYSTYNFNWLETVIRVKTQIGMDVIIGFDVDTKNSSAYTLAMGTPETTNPFPRTSDREYKELVGKRLGLENMTLRMALWALSTLSNRVPMAPPHAVMHLQNKKNSPGHDHSRSIKKYRKLRKNELDFGKMVDDKDNERYNFGYAQLMKIFVSESGTFKDSNLTETELDDNIITTKNAYVSIKADINELETENSTESDEDFQNIPRFTVEELQAYTDRNVEHNNATATPLWKRYLEGIFNVSDVSLDFENDSIRVSEPDLRYLAQIAAYLAKTPPVLIELYIWIKVVDVMAVHTTLLRSSHDYSGSRSLQCANAVNDMLGMAVSYGIADPHFFNVTKPKVDIMLNELKNSLAHLIGQAKWMDDDTKLATYQKIIQMKSLIGFPDWLLEEGKLDEYYKGIEVKTGKHLENMIAIIHGKVKRELNMLRDIHNATWATDPTEVNAYYSPEQNTITVPLVVLQYPFFNLGIDSLNYGSLGTVLGHEITHGFDNTGRYFDKNGNVLPWWKNETIKSFEDKTKCFVDQYSNYYLPQLQKHVDGKKTLGENIADNGGVREALAALLLHLKKTGPERKLPGFEHYSSEQMFFLSYGNLWCGVSTYESLKADLEDEHAPQHIRVTGTLQNVAEFARAWNCPPGSFMNPVKKCIVY